MSPNLLDQFAAWLRNNGLTNLNMPFIKKLWLKIAFWARPINITKGKELDGKKADLYFEVPWNLIGACFSRKMRYKYGLFKTNKPTDYLELDLNGFVFLCEIKGDLVKQIKDYNKENKDKKRYWERSSAILYDLNFKELLRPGLKEQSIFESFLKEKQEIEETKKRGETDNFKMED